MVGQAHAPDLQIVVGGHSHHGPQDDIAILPFELDAVGVEVHFTPVRGSHGGLVRDRPELSIQAVFDVNPVTAIVEVELSCQRVSSISPQRLNPEPAALMSRLYFPFESV